MIWADGAYAGNLATWSARTRRWGKVRLESVRKAKGQRGFTVVAWPRSIDICTELGIHLTHVAGTGISPWESGSVAANGPWLARRRDSPEDPPLLRSSCEMFG